MDDLIARMEKLDGPDRNVDDDICGATESVTDPNTCRAIHYTESVDAAMTLARHQGDMVVMLHAAFKAIEDASGPVNLWPSIKAALIAALRARKALTGGEK